MSRIHLLSNSVIHAIAAGEVVERPSVVVKELIENAIDANATSIEIELENGGLEKICVTDNGIGMDREDLQLSVGRHTTSKISDADDLFQMKTLGFRGEALASIAHASTLTIQSRVKESLHGLEMTLQQDEIIDIVPIGMPVGTRVTVVSLFETLPARKKFLKSASTELKHCIEIITAAAVNHSELHFSLTNNQRTLLSVPEKQTLPQRIESLFGQSVSWIPIEFGSGVPHVTGMIGTLSMATQSTSKQFLFVNHRPVFHTAIQNTVKESYGSLLPPRTEPAFIMHIEVPPNTVDVNIHPRKETIKFFDESYIQDLVRRAVSDALKKTDLRYHYTAAKSKELHVSEYTPTVFTSDPWKFAALKNTEEILQVHQTYLTYQSPDGLMIVDQHAAHERILYEQFLDELEKSGHHSFELPQAVVFTYSPIEKHLLETHADVFTQLGFIFEEFGQNTFKVSHVPSLLKNRDIQHVLKEFLSDLQNDRPIHGLESVLRRTIAYLSCRTAVKAGDFLTQDQRKELLKKLHETKNSATCPHGRPTTIRMDLPELEVLFRRRK